MSSTLQTDFRPDTQPELPILAPSHWNTREIPTSREPRPAHETRETPGLRDAYDTAPIISVPKMTAPVQAPTPPAPARRVAPARPEGAETPRAPGAVTPYTLRLLVDDTFGANADPNAIDVETARTRPQRRLLNWLGARRAVTKCAPAALGAVVAVALGLAMTVVVQLLLDVILALTLHPGTVDPGTAFAENALQALLGGNPVKLFALANLAPVLLGGGTGAGAAGSQLALVPPLNSLLLIPAVALLYGGALSAASDFQRRTRYSVARGALVGPFYALLLTILTVAPTSWFDGRALGIGDGGVLLATPESALFYGLLWGTLFGALGGWTHLHGRRSLGVARAQLSATRFARLTGAFVGAGMALLTGVLACLVVALGSVAYIVVSGQAPAPLANAMQAAQLAGTPGGALSALLLALTLAPTLAVWVWAYACGVPIDLDRVSYAPGGAFGADFASLGLVGAPNGPQHPAWYLLALIPPVCYFCGGRIAARVAGATRPRAGVVAGALMALPLSLLSALLLMLATLSVHANVPLGTLVVDAAPWATQSLALSLVVGALAGGLGGRSGVTHPGRGASLSVRMMRYGRARARLFARIDRVVGRQAGAPMGLARAWAYHGVLAACVLCGGVLVVDIANPWLAPYMSATRLSTLDGVAAALLVAIPLLCFCVALWAGALGVIPTRRQPPRTL
jgi:hypothetical protein